VHLYLGQVENPPALGEPPREQGPQRKRAFHCFFFNISTF
jgi:hypothetical protein